MTGCNCRLYLFLSATVTNKQTNKQTKKQLFLNIFPLFTLIQLVGDLKMVQPLKYVANRKKWKNWSLHNWNMQLTLISLLFAHRNSWSKVEGSDKSNCSTRWHFCSQTSIGVQSGAVSGFDCIGIHADRRNVTLVIWIDQNLSHSR